MTPYWNIVLPYKVSFESKPESQAVFDGLFANDYTFDHVNNYKTESPRLKDGSRITYEHHEKIYYLRPEIIQKEFKLFYPTFIDEFIRFCDLYAERGFKSKVFDKKKYAAFLADFESQELHDFTDEYIATIGALPSNQYLFFDEIYSMIVHEGFTLPNDFNLSVISLLSSSEQMNLIAEETLTFHNFTNYIRKNLSSRFRVARYISNVAY